MSLKTTRASPLRQSVSQSSAPNERSLLLGEITDPEAGGRQHRRTFSLEELVHATNAKKRKTDVYYDGESHVKVLFQLNGSVWPKVFPWCLFSVAYTGILIALQKYQIADLTLESNAGHNFMSILVSFLVVTRVTITYNRFMEARQHLEDLFRNAREIVQYACVFTLTDKDTPTAQKWRQDVAYRAIVTLRMAIAAAEHRSHGVNAWEALPEEEHDNTELAVTPDMPGPGKLVLSDSWRTYKPIKDHGASLQKLTHGPRTIDDENWRAPVVWAFNLKEKVLECRNGLILQHRELHPNEELKLLSLVSDFMTAYHGIKKLVNTPQPFPIVQLARTFLFFWVFSLPMVLISDNNQGLETLLIVFFASFGYLGVEYTCIELDDPYGNDPNDFSGQRWSETTFEDIYISIYKTDGFDSASALRGRVTDRMATGSALDNYQADKQANIFWQGSGVFSS